MNEPWQTVVKEDRTNWMAFPLVFAVVFFLLLFVGGLLSLVIVGRFFPSFGVFNQMLILALAVGVGVSLGNRVKVIHVDNKSLSVSEMRGILVETIELMGFSCVHENDQCVFRNQRALMRIFSDWLGTERIILRRKGKGILLIGPGRYLNDLAWKLQARTGNNQ